MNEIEQGLNRLEIFQKVYGADYVFNTKELERLRQVAELIVKECATAFEAEVDTWKEMDPYQGSIKRQGTKAIKQHFGVEE